MNADLGLLGRARKVVVTKDETSIVDGAVTVETVRSLTPGECRPETSYPSTSRALKLPCP